MYDATPIEPDYSRGFGPQTPGTQPGIHADSLWRVLDEIDEIDDGLILVDGNGLIQHANHLARHELARGQFLCLVQTGDQASATARRKANCKRLTNFPRRSTPNCCAAFRVPPKACGKCLPCAVMVKACQWLVCRCFSGLKGKPRGCWSCWGVKVPRPTWR